MPIINKNIESDSMKKVIKFVKLMTKSMTFDENMESANWVKARKRNNFFYKLMPKEKGINYEKILLGNTNAMLAYGDNVSEDKIILYIHGGGFVTGSAFVSKSYVSALAKYSGYRVIAVDYALAPEEPFPVGFDNCTEAYEHVCSVYPNAKIALVGESAGGNFCLGLAHKYKNTGRVSCVIAHSPTVDFSGCVDHTVNENKDFIVKLGALEPLKRMYVGNNDATNPYISPIYGDFSNFPPIYITCDANETLYADSKTLYEKCEKAGVDVNMLVATGTYHAFAVSGTNTVETTDLLKENIAFITQK